MARVSMVPALAVGPLLLACGHVACSHAEPAPSRAVPEVLSEGAAAPALEDFGEQCIDVADTRACWVAAAVGRSACAQGVCVVPRPLPAVGGDPSGWRCAGVRERRRCFDRTRNAGAFVCTGNRCEQRSPRAPDDGEWECVDRSGVVVCRSRGPAAGVVVGPEDPGWICGERRGVRGSSPAERICVDASPDRAPATASATACQFDYAGGGVRYRCSPSSAPRVGDACGQDRRCPAGAVCARGRCLPAMRPAADCWLDADCGEGGACRLGSCARTAPAP